MCGSLKCCNPTWAGGRKSDLAPPAYNINMIEKIEIHCAHKLNDEKLRTYVTKKIGRLDRYISRHSRESAHVEVHLKLNNSKDKNRFICEVSIHLPHQNIVVTEKALNIYAAIDIAEAKIKQQLQKYKELHSGKTRRHLFGRFRPAKEL
jgi:ribosomal subunit interface protein